MSTHSVDVIRITELELHPSADQLAIVRIGQYQCVVGKDQFKTGDLAYYVEPDYVVPDRPEYGFLKGSRRIKVRRFRGLYSQGLLMPAPDGAREGDNIMEQLGIVRYEPPEPLAGTGGNFAPAPADYPKYDVENWYKYSDILVEGEQVIATEKIHGANSRYVFKDGRMHCGSKQFWREQSDRDLWWAALRQNPWAEEYCRNHPEWVIYGEVFGYVQSLKYGRKPGDYGIAVFDVFTGTADFTNGYLPMDLAHSELLSYWAPIVHIGPYSLDLVKGLAEGPSRITGAKHHREGIVVRPVKERWHPKVGRVQLKIVSNVALEKEK